MGETNQATKSGPAKVEFRREIDDLTGVMQKAASSLLVAHGGALLACLSQLKDYGPDTKLKGIGVFIAAFVAGFILATLGYIDVANARAKILIALFTDDPTGFNTSRIWRGSTLLYLSVAILLLALLAVAWKFIFL
jgi:hypothetical protein